jgi:hypothetical protein
VADGEKLYIVVRLCDRLMTAGQAVVFRCYPGLSAAALCFVTKLKNFHHILRRGNREMHHGVRAGGS